jgi:hypothetical protein
MIKIDSKKDLHKKMLINAGLWALPFEIIMLWLGVRDILVYFIPFMISYSIALLMATSKLKKASKYYTDGIIKSQTESIATCKKIIDLLKEQNKKLEEKNQDLKDEMEFLKRN